MKKGDIKVGGYYIAKISGKLTTVRVDAIRETDGYSTGSSYWAMRHSAKTVYDLTNMATMRKATCRSAAKFRGVARRAGAGPTKAEYEAVLARIGIKPLVEGEVATPGRPLIEVFSDEDDDGIRLAMGVEKTP